MIVSIKHVLFVVVLIHAQNVFCASEQANIISFSFDNLYPRTSLSRALNALRSAWSLSTDLESQQFEADMARHVWLDLYNACAELARDQQTYGLLHNGSHASLIKDDMREYIMNMWQLIGAEYDHIQYNDASFGAFMQHLRTATSQVIDLL
ncbi:MAG: hypothetical protein AB7F19_00565 [Candidatus Babeliales bacterium]